MTEKEQAYKNFLNELKKIALNKKLKNIKSIDSLNEAFEKFDNARTHERKMLNKKNATFGLMNYIMESNLDKLLKSDKNLIKEYEKAMNKSGNPSNADYMNKMEKEFLKFVDKYMPMPGLKLFKVESGGNKEIFLTNGSRDSNQCP